MKITVPLQKPRNHLAAHARSRKGGAHSQGNVRQQQQRSLRRELTNGY
jgi:hypothetical protein